MSTPSTTDRVIRIVAAVFELNAASISPETNSSSVEAWDSLGHLNLMLALEQEFGRPFSIDEMGSMTTIGTIVDVLDGRGSR
jgi:acyl carrier protein